MELDHVSRRDVIKGIVGGLGGSAFATAVPEPAFAQAVEFAGTSRPLLPPLSRACGTASPPCKRDP